MTGFSRHFEVPDTALGMRPPVRVHYDSWLVNLGCTPGHIFSAFVCALIFPPCSASAYAGSRRPTSLPPRQAGHRKAGTEQMHTRMQERQTSRTGIVESRTAHRMQRTDRYREINQRHRCRQILVDGLHNRLAAPFPPLSLSFNVSLSPISRKVPQLWRFSNFSPIKRTEPFLLP